MSSNFTCTYCGRDMTVFDTALATFLGPELVDVHCSAYCADRTANKPIDLMDALQESVRRARADRCKT